MPTKKTIFAVFCSSLVFNAQAQQAQAYDNRDYIDKLNQNSHNGVSYQENRFINHTQAEFDQFFKAQGCFSIRNQLCHFRSKSK